MGDVADELRELATTSGFSGVVRIDAGDEVLLEAAFGSADRAHDVAVTPATKLAVASGVKGFTALTVMSLVEEGLLTLATTARSLLGGDLRLIADDVTVEHLLAHRSGIGDYLDEDSLGEISDYVMTEPVHRLATTEAYLPMLEGHPMHDAPGEVFRYNNGAFVVLALLAERAAGAGFHELVEQRVCRTAGLVDTAFLRTDELPGDAALGYLAADGLRTNLLHLPVRGSGDGGIFTTAADVQRFWEALFGGSIVTPGTVAEMVRPRSTLPSGKRRYGLGFWLHRSSDAVLLEGYDAGVSFRTLHQPSTATTYSVLANTSEGAWPLVARLDELLAP
jgi:CubicO group peptidase (beta-lactamase class C family)